MLKSSNSIITYQKKFDHLNKKILLSVLVKIRKQFTNRSVFLIQIINFIIMLRYAVIFFIISIIAAVLGFGGIAAGAAGIAKIFFYVFIALAVIMVLGTLFIGKKIID